MSIQPEELYTDLESQAAQGAVAHSRIQPESRRSVRMD